jgi:hypothetical protein
MPRRDPADVAADEAHDHYERLARILDLDSPPPPVRPTTREVMTQLQRCERCGCIRYCEDGDIYCVACAQDEEDRLRDGVA